MGLAGVLASERQAAFKVLDALLHHDQLGREFLHPLQQRPEHPDQLVLLPMAQLCQVGQALHLLDCLSCSRRS